MKKHKVRSVIFISAAGVGDSWKQIPWTSKLLFKTMLKTVIAEHAKEEDIFKASGLEWTAIRAAVLSNGKSGDAIIADNTSKLKTITREGLAGFLVDLIDSKKFVNQAIGLAQK